MDATPTQLWVAVAVGGIAVAYVVLGRVIRPKEVKFKRARPVEAYGRVVEAAREGEGPAYGSVVETDPDYPVTTLYDNFQRGRAANPDGPCLGYRPVAEGKAGAYVWSSYDEINTRIEDFGSGLRSLDLIPKSGDSEALRFLGLYSKNMMQWVIAEQACNAYEGVVVPLYDTLGADAVEYVLNQTEMATMCCSPLELKTVLEIAPKCRGLRTVIVFSTADPAKDEELMAAAGAAKYMEGGSSRATRSSSRSGLRVMRFEEVEEHGHDHHMDPVSPEPDAVATFCYTSGTTGDPKGAMLSHKNIVADLRAATAHGVQSFPTDVHLSYLPLAHMFERIMQASLLGAGGCVGFYQGDTLKLVEDIGALRPTIFPSVPRLFNKFYDKIVTGASASKIKGTLFKWALNAKLRGLRAGYLEFPFWDKIVFSKVAARLGLDRCRLMVTGSAPIAAHVMDFLRVAFCCPVVEGYGQTECAAASTLTLPSDYSCGHVGGPIGCNLVKLVNVEEMGYTADDRDHQGQPCLGRGEVCFKGDNVFRGYYKMPEKTREAVDADGWLHSGDIGIWMPNLALRIVDRKKNIFKLSQGEYVAPEKIENVQAKAPLVGQSFVYGDSMQAVLVAVVVPDPDAAKVWASANGKGAASIADLCEDADFKAAVAAEIKAVCKESKLKGFEMTKELRLVPDLWTPENELLTPTFKKKRRQLQEKFQHLIDDMYASYAVAGKKGVKQGR